MMYYQRICEQSHEQEEIFFPHGKINTHNSDCSTPVHLRKICEEGLSDVNIIHYSDNSIWFVLYCIVLCVVYTKITCWKTVMFKL